jgi:hypothetical protein
MESSVAGEGRIGEGGAGQLITGVMKKKPRRFRKVDAIGLCLKCGHRLTFCGQPFTAEIPCSKCLYINVYKESRQPVGGRY